MPTLEQALSHLRQLPSHPPYPAKPVEVLHRRARRVRRGRWAARGLAVVAVVVLGTTVAITRPSSEPGLQSVPSSTTTPDPQPTLTVVPSEGLRPNQVVTITLLAGPAIDSIIVAQCGSEATRAAPEQWCQTLQSVQLSSPRQQEVRVRRVIETTNGRIDCAERAERCVLGVRLGTDDYTTPISFDHDLGPLNPRIAVETTSPFLATVSGSGYEPGASVTIAQCRPAPDQPSTSTFGDCDHHRSVNLTVGDDGTFTVEAYLYQEIFDDYSGWGPCDPCRLQATSSTADTQAADVDTRSGLPGRATVEIRPSGPYAPGEIVELHGSGFPPGLSTAEITIGWCRFNTPDPTTEPQGVGPEYADCAYPFDSTPVVTTDDAGNFTIPGFHLPDGPFGANQVTCDDPAARCGLAWHPGEGAVPYFVTEFKITDR